MGHCLRVFRRSSRTSVEHDVAVLLFFAHFFISRQFFQGFFVLQFSVYMAACNLIPTNNNGLF
jgi:hypothetical protein